MKFSAIAARVAWAQRLHDWVARSIVNRATVTGILFVLFMTLFLALASLPVIYQQVAGAQAADTRNKTLRLQEYFEFRLDTVSGQLQALARNRFVVNAFIDSSGLDVYLQPLLRDFQLPFGLAGQLVVLDINHARIAAIGRSDLSELSSPAVHPVARQALSTGKPGLGLDADGKTLVFAAPVFYPPASSFVGTVVLRLPVAQLFDAPPRYVNASQCYLVSSDQRVLYQPPCPAGALNLDTAAAPVQALRLGVMGAPIGIQFRDYKESLAAPLGSIFLNYVFLALLCGILALVLLEKRVRSLTRPLLEFSRVAQEIAADPKSTAVATTTGVDEVGKLGEAFNSMLFELRSLQSGLEMGIAVATHELRIAKEQAESANLFKSQFLANMSHEIRTPMSAILGMLALMQHTELTRQQLDYTTKSERAARSLLALINDILDFSKVEAGKMTLDPQPFRVDQMLRDLGVILSAGVGGDGLEVLFDIDIDLPQVLVGDSLRLQQVLINLGSNAVKFTAAGQVVISLRQLEARAQSVVLAFAVKDSGPGIAPEHHVHIFSGFSQAEASTTRRFGGTGLGLAISQRLVALMGASLDVCSAPGQGSTFSFVLELPTVAVVPPQLAEPARLAAPAQHVLVIDDNAMARSITLQMARSWGWPVEAVDSGDAAISLIESRSDAQTAFPFDVIFLDWQMPQCDGWETAKRIRRISEQCSGAPPRIIMLTANNRDTLAQRTQEEQALLSGFLVKPVTASVLQEAALANVNAQTRLLTAAPRIASQRRLSGMRILVVEDNLINQQVAEQLLISEGAVVCLAANGQLGVDAVAAASPQFDIVLMDIQMPIMDGFAATQAIRQLPGLCGLQIVAMTSNATVSDRHACLAAGMNAHVSKPFDLSQLVTLLLSLTPRIDAAAAISRMSGDVRLYRRAALDFARDLPTVAAQWALAVIGDLRLAAMQMHTLKGTSATLGDHSLMAVASRLEQMCRTASPSELLTEVAALDWAAQASLTAFNAQIAALPEEPAANAASGPVDVAAVRATFRMLKPLLAAHDLGALDLFARQLPALQTLPAALLRPLEQALQSFEMETALGLCTAIEAQLDLPD